MSGGERGFPNTCSSAGMIWRHNRYLDQGRFCPIAKGLLGPRSWRGGTCRAVAVASMGLIRNVEQEQKGRLCIVWASKL